jgi:hypothetical protein
MNWLDAVLVAASRDGRWIAWALVGFMVYVGALPLLIWKTFKQESEPTLQLIDPATCPLPPDVQQNFDRAEVELIPAGFEVTGTLFLPSSVPNVKPIVRLYVNRPQKDMAMVASIFTESQSAPQHHKYVEFCTRFADGLEINTGNTEVVGSFPPRPQVSTTHYPWIKSAAELYRVHQAVLRLKAPGAAKALTFEREYHGDGAAYLAAGIKRELAEAANAGYVYLDSATGQYRATLKGAYLMTWKQLPPFKQVVETLRRKRAERLMKESGVG